MSHELFSKIGELVENYVNKRASQALVEVEKKRHGEGCLCNQCVLKPVEDANYWIEDAIGDPEQAEIYKYSAVSQRNKGFKIFRGFDWFKGGGGKKNE